MDMEDSLVDIVGLGDRSVGSTAPMRNDSGPAKLARASTEREFARASNDEREFARACSTGRAPDALSEVLRLVRLTGAVFLNAEMGAPWQCARRRRDSSPPS
jgi:hypothetical protein